jgi:hypothetical protein
MPGPLSLQTSRNNFLSTRPKANNGASPQSNIIIASFKRCFLNIFEIIFGLKITKKNFKPPAFLIYPCSFSAFTIVYVLSNLYRHSVNRLNKTIFSMLSMNRIILGMQ